MRTGRKYPKTLHHNAAILLHYDSDRVRVLYVDIPTSPNCFNGGEVGVYSQIFMYHNKCTIY
jgi:hypothetical protein